MLLLLLVGMASGRSVICERIACARNVIVKRCRRSSLLVFEALASGRISFMLVFEGLADRRRSSVLVIEGLASGRRSSLLIL